MKNKFGKIFLYSAMMLVAAATLTTSSLATEEVTTAPAITEEAESTTVPATDVTEESTTAPSTTEGEETTTEPSTSEGESTTAPDDTTNPDDTTDPVLSGFVKNEDGLYYYLPETGEKLIPEKAGVQVIEGKNYLMDTDGKIQEYVNKKPFTFNSNKYCLNKDNTLVSGLYKYSSTVSYYFSIKTFKLTTGWVTLKDGKRYFGSNGKMYTGLKTISKKTYYFDNSGVMKTGFVTTDDGKRYFGTDGVMYTGLKTISKKTYYFNSKGIMKTGFVSFDEGKRYFKKDSGVMLTGKQKIDGKYYYFNSKGIMKTGWVTIDSNKYYFSKKDGSMLTGWNKISSKYYYFASNGKMAKSKIVGNYYVLSDGTRATSKAVSYAVAAINAATTSSMTKEQKLKACYNWIIKSFVYKRDYQDPATLKTNWTLTYAEYAFKNKMGNCYKYASAFGYCAEILGYDARVVYGKYAKGNSRVAHGWTEVKVGSTYYIYDTVHADYYKGNYYKRTYSNYPGKLFKSGTKDIVLS